MTKYCAFLAMLLLALTPFQCRAMPMANEDELVSLDSSEHVQAPQDLSHILKISPKQTDPKLEVQPNVFDTIVEELRAAGVQAAGQNPLQTLSYKELTRLLAMWHMTQGRNFYEANENSAAITSNKDSNGVDASTTRIM